MADAPTTEITRAIVFYSLCSASLLLVNKLVMFYLPLPSFVGAIQFAFAALAVICMKQIGLVNFDSLPFEKLSKFFIYVISFVIGLYANFKALEVSTVETVIVFRSCTPLCVSILEWWFLGRALPSLRSLGAMSLIGLGAFGYVSTDKAFELSGMEAYTWALIYFGSLSFQMTYGKIITNTLKLSTWENVYYTNILSLLPIATFGYVMQEHQKLQMLEISSKASMLTFLLISCIAGLCIGWSGWRCRQLVSAASYTLIGVTNKILTVLVNCMIWDQHASTLGICCLFFCLVGGALYKQAPMRSSSSKSAEALQMSKMEEEETPLAKNGMV